MFFIGDTSSWNHWFFSVVTLVFRELSVPWGYAVIEDKSSSESFQNILPVVQVTKNLWKQKLVNSTNKPSHSIHFVFNVFFLCQNQRLYSLSQSQHTQLGSTTPAMSSWAFGRHSARGVSSSKSCQPPKSVNQKHLKHEIQGQGWLMRFVDGQRFRIWCNNSTNLGRVVVNSSTSGWITIWSQLLWELVGSICCGGMPKGKWRYIYILYTYIYYISYILMYVFIEIQSVSKYPQGEFLNNISSPWELTIDDVWKHGAKNEQVQLMANWWFGARWCGIRIGYP